MSPEPGSDEGGNGNGAGGGIRWAFREVRLWVDELDGEDYVKQARVLKVANE